MSTQDKPWKANSLEIASSILGEILKVGKNIKCPLHNGGDPNCAVYDDHFHCFSHCGSFDVSTLHQTLTNGSHSDFLKAFGYETDFNQETNEARLQRIARQVDRQKLTEAKEQWLAMGKMCLNSAIEQFDCFEWRGNFIEECGDLLCSSRDLYQDWKLLLTTLFDLDSYIWLGEVNTNHGNEFNTLNNWLRKDNHNYGRFAMGEFENKATRRTKDNVCSCNFILIEFDELIGFKVENDEQREDNKRMSASVINWLRTQEGMMLRVVYDTGSKSLHSLWDKPDDQTMDLLKSISGKNGIGFDKSPLEASNAPLRLPNTIHEATGNPSSLLYLNPKQL